MQQNHVEDIKNSKKPKETLLSLSLGCLGWARGGHSSLAGALGPDHLDGALGSPQERQIRGKEVAMLPPRQLRGTDHWR